MKIRYLILFYLIFSTALKAENFQEIIKLNEQSDVLGTKRHCDFVKPGFEPENFLCAFINASDKEFILFMSSAVASSHLTNFWKIDFLISTDKSLTSFETINRDQSYVNRINRRIVNLASNNTPLSRESCLLLKRIYKLSDGYFAEGLQDMIESKKDFLENNNCRIV